MQRAMDWLQSHPLMAAIIIFLAFFIGYNIYKSSKSTSKTALPGGAGTGSPLAPGTGVGGPTGQEVYASQLYQYPTYNAPVVNQNAPPPVTTTTTPVTNPPPASQSVYHGILSVMGSIHPLNIGPWVAGRQVTVNGGSYTLKPGGSGRLWGIDKATGNQVNLWDGNDYAGGPRTAATVGGF